MYWASGESRGIRDVWIGACLSILAPVATAQPIEMLVDLLDGLEAEQRDQALFPLAAKQRTEWTYVPWGHEGLPLREMSEDQRQATDALVRSALSPSGIQTYLGVIELENELWENTWFKWFRDPGEYYLAGLGEQYYPWRGWPVGDALLHRRQPSDRDCRTAGGAAGPGCGRGYGPGADAQPGRQSATKGLDR